MARIALIFISVFLFVQIALCVREKRDDPETTTANILDSIKTGIENTFSEQNIKKAVDNLNEFGDKLKEIGGTVITNFQNALKSDEKPATK